MASQKDMRKTFKKYNFQDNHVTLRLPNDINFYIYIYIIYWHLDDIVGDVRTAVELLTELVHFLCSTVFFFYYSWN